MALTFSAAGSSASATGGSTWAQASCAMISRSGGGGLVVAEQDGADVLEHADVARKPADHVEARPERQHAFGRNAPVRRAQSDDAAIACRNADRAAAVGAEREIDEPARHRRRRAVRRAARHAARRIDVHAACRNARSRRSGCSRARRNGSWPAMSAPARADAAPPSAVSRRRRMRAQPVGLAEAGARPCDLEGVLCGEGQAGERPAPLPFSAHGCRGRTPQADRSALSNWSFAESPLN